MIDFRSNFPIFDKFKEPSLAYLDSAASTQKPQQVIEAITNFYSSEYSNIHRGAYRLSSNATDNYEAVRFKVKDLINSESHKNIIFTRGATEAINLVANSFENYFEEGDVILISTLEHHSNIVPWQLLAERKKLKIKFIDIDENAELILSDYEKKLQKFQPKLVAITYISNAFGTITPIKDIINKAHRSNAVVLVDIAQAVAHKKIDVQEMGVDFAVFSGHKLYGPTGVGVLYAKKQHLDLMQPFMGGGDMISYVGKEGSQWAEIPAKFEAGTPPIAEVIGLGAAIDFVNNIGFENIREVETNLIKDGLSFLSEYKEVTIYGPKDLSNRGSVISFNFSGVHPHDLATIADSFNVQIRAGFHCAMPALHAINLSATARISFGVYSLKQDLIQLGQALNKARSLFHP